MKHEIYEKKISVENSDISFESIYQKSWFPNEIADDVKKANFLIIPSDYCSDDSNIVFPETTTDFYDYIKSNSNGNVVCDIAVSEDNYQKIEKHSALIDIATVIVNSGLLPIAINLISSFIYDLLSRYRRKSEETSAKVTILAEQTKSKKTVKIEYEGPASEVKETLENTIKDVFGN